MPKPLLASGIVALLALPLSEAQAGFPATNSPATMLTSEPIDCVAVFELVERELPYQLRQSEMRLARQVWQLRAGQVTQNTQTDLGAQVNQRLALLSVEYSDNPQRLAQAADRCRLALRPKSTGRF